MTRWIPFDGGLEHNVLMMMMTDQDSAVLGVARLLPDDFYLEKNANYFQAIASLVRDRRNVDYFSITERMMTLGLGSASSEDNFLESATEPGAAATGYLEEYVGYLKALTLRRLAINKAIEVGHAATDRAKDNDTVVELFQTAAHEVAGKTAGEALVSFADSTPAAIEWIDNVAQGLLPGVKTGMRRFDKFFGGLVGGDLMVLGARPSQGKTALALAIAIEAAKQGQCVAFFSMEMRKRELQLRAYCRERNLDIATFRDGTASSVERAFLMEAAQSMRDLPIYFDDTPRRTPLQIQAAVRSLSYRRKPDLVLVDYLTMMKGDGKHENRRHELSYCARGMKDCAGDLDLPVVLLSQLNRTMENEHREPRSADLRETGEIEEAADIVALIHRPFTYDPKADPRFAKILVPKFRNGPTGWFKMTFEARCAGYYDWIEPHFLEGVEFPNFLQLQGR